ncbi:MAG: VWA domain-containing protein [Vicinamibacteria bacterium]
MSAATAAGEDPPVFRSSVEQVLVDVVVQDARGRPVTDLTREDFAIAEDGIAQTISSFEPPLAAKPSGPGSGDGLGPIAIVFDDLGLNFSEAARARKALSTFARSGAARSVAFLATTSGRVRWPDEHAESLVRVVERLSGLDPRGLGSAPMTGAEACLVHVDHDAATLARVEARYAAAGIAEGLREATRPLVQAEAAAACQRAKSHSRRVLDELGRASDRLSSWTGRRSALLISAGLPRDAALPERQRLLDSSRRANVALHFLDASAVQGTALSVADVDLTIGPADDLRVLSADSAKPSAAGSDRDPDRAASEGTASVAEETGGLVVRRTNDLAKGLDRIAADYRLRYTLGYDPTRAIEDDRYRAISVRLAPDRSRGRRGWTVRARRGYFPARTRPPVVLATGGGVAPADAGKAKAAAAEEGAALPMRLRAECLEDLPGEPSRVRCVVAAAVDLRSVNLEEEGPRRKARLAATFAVAAGEATEPIRIDRRVDLDLLARSAQLRNRWLPIEVEIPLPRGLHDVSATVRDEASGRSGETHLALDVPPAGVLRVSRRHVADKPNDDEAKRRTDDDDGTRVFTVGATVFLSFDLFGDVVEAGTGRPSVTFAAGVETTGGGKALSVRPEPFRPVSGGLRASVRVSLAGVRPGEYRFVGRVADAHRRRGIAIEEPFTVVSGETSAPNAPLDPGLAELLDKAGRYVAEYERAFRNIVADEDYEQRTSTSASGQPDRRRTRADLVFVRLAGPIPWASFRDVYEVDGSTVRDRSSRLLELFARPSRSAYDKAEAILAESTRYNIGVERTVNLPTLPLVFLLPRNRTRFAFTWREKPRAGEPTEIAFREIARPTLIRNRKPDSESDAESRTLDLPADGRFWIDPRGVVVRSELRLRTGLSDTSAELSTRYRPEPRLAMWVPEEMKEHYVLTGPNIPVSIASHGNEFVLDAIARYTNLRRFQVTTDEAVTTPEAAPPP